jgi:hypothetical protein
MKIKKWHKLYVTTICLMLAPLVRAQDTSKDVFKVSAVLSQLEIYPYEPLEVQGIFTNSTKDSQTHTSNWGAGVFIRKGDKDQWEKFSRHGPRLRPPLPQKRTFQAGEQVSFFEIIDVNTNDLQVFAEPGAYWVKVKLADIESEPVKLEVKQPPLADKQAAEQVKKIALYRFFSDASASHYGRKGDPTKELQTCIAQFPNSRYAWWARLGLLLVKKHQSGENAAVLKGIQAQMEQFATQAPAPINASFWYEAGIIAAKRGDGTAAHANFEKAIATKASATLADQIAHLKSQGLIPAKVAAPPDDGLTDELRESLTNRLKIFMAAARLGSTPPDRYFTEDFVWDGKLNRQQTAALLAQRVKMLRKGHPDSEDVEGLLELELVRFDLLGDDIMATVKIIITPTGKPEVQQCQFILRKVNGNWYIRRWDGDILKRLEEK